MFSVITHKARLSLTSSSIPLDKKVHAAAIGQFILLIRWRGCSDFDICERHAYPLLLVQALSNRKYHHLYQHLLVDVR